MVQAGELLSLGMAKTGKDFKLFEQVKSRSIYKTAIHLVTDLTIAVSQISGYELTEAQILFLKSPEFRKIMLADKINIINFLLYGNGNIATESDNKTENSRPRKRKKRIRKRGSGKHV